MKFFGRRYSSPVYDDTERVAVPVGVLCAHCKEPIAADDDGWLIPYLTADQPDWDDHHLIAFKKKTANSELTFHAACYMRGIIGSVAHQQGRCSCFVDGSVLEDDPALTVRQAAIAAEEYFHKHFSFEHVKHLKG